MSRTTTLLLLGATLMTGLALWLDGRQDGAEQDKNPAAVPAVPLVMIPNEPTAGIEAGRLSKASLDSSSVDRTPLAVKVVEASVPGHVGPTFRTRLRLKLRTAEYFRSPPAAGLGVELRYWTKGQEETLVLAKLRSDYGGVAVCDLNLPADADGRAIHATLTLVPIDQGYQEVSHRIRISNSTREVLERDLVMLPGTRVRVRAVGLKEPGKPRGMGFPLTVRRIGSDQAPITTYFGVDAEGEESQAIATFPLQEKGRYQLIAHCAEGAGAVKSIRLDPAAPPEEITILIGEYGTIAGRVVMRHAPPEQELRVRAVAAGTAETGGPPNPYLGVDWNSPPRWTESLVDPEDGSFRITGLAPGSYRLAFLGRYLNSDLGGWFDTPPVSTGTRDLDLDLQETLLVLDLQRNPDRDGTTQNAFTPEVHLQKLPTAGDANAYEVRSEQFERATRGYALVPGNRYRLLVWSPRHPVVEKEFDAPTKGGIWRLEIPLASSPPGTLKWTGPTDEIRYRILSPKFAAEIVEWRVRLSSTPAKRFMLPPGRYLMRAEGVSRRDFMHGSLGKSRTPYGVQELWAEIRSGETTTLEFDPPRCGWLEIELDAVGQPDPSQSGNGFLPPLHSLDIMGVYFHQGKANLVMHDQTSGASRALTFQHYGGGSFHYEDAQMIPGETMKPIEVFLPGKYDLEIRIPGFPMQKREVVIEEGRLTEVKIVLQGKK